MYVRPFTPASDAIKWPVSTDGGTAPRWASGGRELLYISGGELVTAEVVSDGTFTLGGRRTLFATAGFIMSYDVSPDGRRFVCMRSIDGDAATTERVIVVDNFVEELKAMVRN